MMMIFDGSIIYCSGRQLILFCLLLFEFNIELSDCGGWRGLLCRRGQQQKCIRAVLMFHSAFQKGQAVLHGPGTSLILGGSN